MGVCVNFCEDVLVEILCRCPEKDLIRFMCVSKSWYLIINQFCIPKISLMLPTVGLYFYTLDLSDHVPRTPSQIRRNYVKSVSHDKMMLEYASLSDSDCCKGGGGAEFNYKSFEYQFGYDLLDSCNGLLLFVSKSVCQYYVCNPTFKQFVPIPKARFHTCSTTYCALTFNPSESIHFKVVRFADFKSESGLLDIYSSITGQWVRRVLQLDPLVPQSTMRRYSVKLNGVIYRLCSQYLLCLDLSVMNARVIIPPMAEKGDYSGCIGIWMGRLCLAKRKNNRLFVWSLEDQCKAGTEWVLTFSVNISVLMWHELDQMKHPRLGYVWIEPIGFCPNSDLIFFATPCMIVSYDLKSNKVEEVYRTRDGVRCYQPLRIVARSLVSLNHLGLMQCKSAQLKTIPEGMEILELEMPFDDSNCNTHAVDQDKCIKVGAGASE